jgi:hypothetical protein
MKTKTILAALLCGVVFVSCSVDNPDASEQETDKTPIHSITIDATAPMGEVTIATKGSDVAETTLEGLALVLVPKTDGGKAVVIDNCTLSAPTQVTTTNYKYTATFTFPEGKDEVYKGEYYLYAIGNPGKQYVAFNADDLKGKTKEQIDSWIITKANAEPDFSESALLMTGKYGNGDGSVTLSSYDNKLTDVISLSRVVSKSTFTFVNGSSYDHGQVTFVPESYSIYNYSLASSLIERSGWSKATPGSGMDYFGGTDASKAFASRENIPIDKSGVFSFYMPENVQTRCGTLPEGQTWEYKMREVRQDQADNDYKTAGKHSVFAYAPANATYVVVKGEYSDDHYTGKVSYTIHLGEFTKNPNSFSVRRNCKYNYKITINGVTNIIAEAKAETDDLFQPGAEGDIVVKDNERTITLDCHYEQAIYAFDLPGAGSKLTIMAKTPYSNGLQIVHDWTGTDMSYISWAKFAKPTSISSFASPGPDFTDNSSSKEWAYLPELLKDLTERTGKYYYTDDQYPGLAFVAVYVDEYIYEGKPLSDFINADPRTLQLSVESVNVSKDGQSVFTSEVIFRLDQKSIRSDLDLDVLANPFGFESVEETKSYCGDDSPTTGEAVSAKVSTGKDVSNGWANFVDWFSTNDNPILYEGTTKWATLVNVRKNGYIPRNNNAPGKMVSAYDYGWYQCLTRNRDENGDGYIQERELKWFLPAVGQYVDIMFANPNYFSEFVTGVDNPLYLTSTAGADQKRVWFAAEGIAIGNFGLAWWNNWNIHTRCVRSLGAYNAAPTKTFSYDESTRVLTVSGYKDNVMRQTGMTGGYPTHNLSNAEYIKLPPKFVIAADYIKNGTQKKAFTKDEINGADVCASMYYEESDQSDKGKWRIPNLKEFFLMSIAKDLDGLVVDKTVCRTTSYLFNRGGAYTDGGDMPIFYYKTVSTDSNFNPFNSGGAYVRCVRDAE